MFTITRYGSPHMVYMFTAHKHGLHICINSEDVNYVHCNEMCKLRSCSFPVHVTSKDVSYVHSNQM